MLFNSAVFAVFFALVFGVYWALPRRWLREQLLLVSSLAFYGFWDFRFLLLIGFVVVVSFYAGWWIGKRPTSRRLMVPLACVLLLGQLFIFKYADFLLGSFAELLAVFGGRSDFARFNLTLPVGISFYTFQALSYVVDVHKGHLDKPQGLLRVALYITFFPQLVAGPIVRADQFFPELDRGPSLDGRNALVGVKLIAIGLVYKSIFADRIGPLIDPVFDKPLAFDLASRVWAVVGFYGQIYFDFAGYSTMAIGLSRLFGIRLPKNFDFPYRAANVTDFWRRWHISLSSWLRDYLYIPLGGNRGSRWFRHRNLMLTMLLGGLWHGASWNFVAWGAMHGLALVAHKEFSDRLPKGYGGRVVALLRGGLGWTLTQAFVLLTWIPFRAQSFDESLVFAQALASLGPAGKRTIDGSYWLLVLPVLCDHLLVSNPRLPRLRWPGPAWAGAAVVGLLLALALPFMHLEVKSFIYFQF
jgi:D-alanyl-lipoteichoic acid acyltransferase DltB (MBOAT superfamily)